MLELSLEVVVELLLWPFYALAAGLLTVLGILAEEHSLASYAAGDLTLAAWFGVVGLVALYAGVYVLGYQTLLRRLVRSAG